MRTDFLAWLITAIAVTTSAYAQNIPMVRDIETATPNLQSLMLNRLQESNSYSLYGDPAREFWNTLQQSSLPEYEDKFYGRKVKIEVKDKENNVLYFCTTSDPSLFWQLVLIPPEGDSVECENNNEN